MIEEVIKVFLLEDEAVDRELIKRKVSKIAPNATFVQAANREEFEKKIHWATPDIVLSDYKIPGYSGLHALLLIREKMPHVPFVFVSGALNNEEEVANTILQGASGYILKDNLDSMGDKLPAILGESRARYLKVEVALQRERKQKILLQKLNALVEQSNDFEQKAQILSVLSEIQELSHSGKKLPN